jgi:hypothetical protein
LERLARILVIVKELSVNNFQKADDGSQLPWCDEAARDETETRHAALKA